MTDREKKTISDLLDAINKNIDASKSFAEKVLEITSKVESTLSIIAPEIDLLDPEVDKMIKKSVVIVEEKAIVFADKGYTPWLNDVRTSIDWNFYNRYEKYLVKKKNWNWGTVQSINETTDVILDHMQNPSNDKFFGVKGLVMGDIQSGKTANYTALINKCLDAKYKLIIVLAGLTKDLRSQTQKRLDKEVLGYETRLDFSKGSSIGVGEYSESDCEYSVNAITNSGEGGDFNKKVADAFNTVLSNGMQPLIAVLKKNSSVLKALIDGVLSSDVGAKTNGKFDIPVLIIDDEVDQASVNTKKESIDEASTINKLIREMLKKFNRFSYVGYTATPYANVFINPYGFENEDEKDLFPEDFVVCLARPQSYCGVKEYFGIDVIDSNEDADAPNLDLYEKIYDYYELFDDDTKKTKKIQVDTPVVRINASMEDALKHFIISSAIKYSRGIIEHNSMLIHIARFKNPATSLRDIVKAKLIEMQNRYLYGGDVEKQAYKQYWETKIRPISEKRLLSDFHDSWDKIDKYLDSVFDMSIQGIKVINGDTADVCDYESSNAGQHIIIGGDKLSRGLTLEGLIVSYYNRNSKQYDTLLQMGRWFGYREGWLDLCRIFTTNSLVNDFINAGIATEMFKNDIQEMNSLKLTPSEFGLKIKHSPNLAPTSRSKMRSGKKMKISFSGSLQQLLSYKKSYVSHNRSVTESFIKSLKNGDNRKTGNIVFNNVNSQIILEYLSKYKECDELVGSVSIKNWIKYISELNKIGELIDWTVVLHSNSNKNDDYIDEIGGYKIYKNQNTDRNLYADNDMDTLYLKAVTSPSDFREFYLPGSAEYSKINSYKADDPIIKSTFTKEKGLLAIYSIDFYKKVFDKEVVLPNGSKRKIYKPGFKLDGGSGVIGLGAWFSQASNYETSAVEFYVNAVYQNKLDELSAEDEND